LLRFKINKVSPEFKVRTVIELKTGEVLVNLVKIVLTGMLRNEMSEYGKETEEWRQALVGLDRVTQIDQRLMAVKHIVKEVLKVNRDVDPSLAKQGDEFELARVTFKNSFYFFL
jgi:hypothetical protein